MKTEITTIKKSQWQKATASVDWYFWCIVALGIFIRIVGFGSTPCGFNQDEAFAGYEAFSLLNYGVDSAGYRNPVYFVSWGSGMNVLESYLAIPFMKILGPSIMAVRLPQLLIACLSLPVFYKLIKIIFSRNTALIGVFLLAISPWHIALSRWGLESNLSAGLLLMGFYFFVRGITENKFFIFSAVLYGLALYSYAITWIVVPLTLLLFGLYLIITKQKISLKYVIISGIILFTFALPLILFLLVNKGFIPEISTSFLSIPKLLSMRTGELSLANLFKPQSYYNLLNIFIKQTDGLIWNTTTEFGMFYKISFPFIVLGGVKIFSTALSALRQKVFRGETLIFLGMTSALLTALMIDNLNVNKANSLHFYTLILLTIGIKEVCVIGKKYAVIPKTIFCCYTLYFIFFSSFYFGQYNNQISETFRNGAQDAITYVKTQGYEDICVDSSIYYPQVLFFDQTPHSTFKNTVKYTSYPAAFLNATAFGNYTFGIDYQQLNPKTTYIIKNNAAQHFISNDYQLVYFENYAVATKN